MGATPQQVRTALFNRALSLAKMGNVGGCSEALDLLRASLLGNRHGTEGTHAGTESPKRKNKKKKNLGGNAALVASGGGESRASAPEDVPTAKPASEAEAVAWMARADWIQSELIRASSSHASDDAGNESTGGKNAKDVLDDAIAKLDRAAAAHADDEASGALTFMQSQLLLHRAVVANPQSKTRPLIDALESLPPPVKSCPGTIVTLAALYGSSSDKDSIYRAEQLLSSLGEAIPARLARAEFLMEQSRFEEAAQLLQAIVEEAETSTAKAEEEDSTTQVHIMTATALLVKALSYFDSEKAAEFAERLPAVACGDEGASELDGEALEKMDIPRFSKMAMGAGDATGEGGSSSKIRKLIAATGGRSTLG